MNEINLWKVRGNCPIHGAYIYHVKKDEESVGCPVCKSMEIKESETSGNAS